MIEDAKTALPDESDEIAQSATKRQIRISEKPAALLSKEGFALYVGKTPAAVVAMAKAGKLPAFYMADPLKPGGHAELWINRHEWDKFAEQLVEQVPEEWHGWKERISASKPRRRVARVDEMDVINTGGRRPGKTTRHRQAQRG